MGRGVLAVLLMAITFFGEAVTPADNGAQAGPGPQAITPPESMQAGDLVVVFAQYEGPTAAQWILSTSGGQAWSAYRQGIFTPAVALNRVFFCRFNGTWAANPSFDSRGSTLALTLTMLVFRPSSGSKFWVPDPMGSAAENATATTQTITGHTTTKPSTVSIGFWLSQTAVTWGTLTGSGWSKSGLTAQYRNTTDTDMSGTAAYNIRTSAGAVADVSQTQSASQATLTWMMAFAEIDLPTGSGGAGSMPVQVKYVDNLAPGTTQALAFASPVGAGRAVIGYVAAESVTVGGLDTHVDFIDDDQGNLYTIIQIVTDIALDQFAVMFFCPGLVNAPTTVTVHFNAAPAFVLTMMMAEVAGITGLDQVKGLEHPAAAGATLDIEAVTTTANGEYIFAWANNVGTFFPHPYYDFTAWGTKRLEGEDNVSGGDTAIGDAVQAVAGSFHVTIALTDAAEHLAGMATFFPAPAGEVLFAQSVF